MRTSTGTLLSLVATCLTALASAAEPNILLRPDWKAGDTRRLECVSIRERELAGAAAPKRTVRETVDCQIVSADETGYVIDWKLLDGAIETETRDPLMEALADLWKGQSLVVELNPDGTVRKLKNVAELKNRLEFAVEAILDRLRKQGASAASTAAIGRQLLDTFATEKTAATLLTRDIALYFALLDKPLGEGQPFEYEALLDNPLGGQPFPATGRFAIAELDPQQQQATITWSQVPDPEKATQILFDSATQLARRLGRPAPAQATDVPPLQISDTCTFELDISSGWVQSLKHTREATMQDYVQRDIKEIRIVEAK